MATASGKDGNNTASVSGTVSVRSVALIALCSAFASGAAPTCSSRQDEIVHRLDRLEHKIDAKLERVAERHDDLAFRVARLEGARGTSSQ